MAPKLLYANAFAPEAYASYSRAGSTLFPSYFGVSLLKLNIRKKGTLILKELLGNLVFAWTFREGGRVMHLYREHGSCTGGKDNMPLMPSFREK